MFLVEVGSVVVTVLFVKDFGDSSTQANLFAGLDRRVALDHRPLRELRRGHGRGAGQGAGRRACAGPAPRRSPASGSTTAPSSSVPSARLVAGDVVVVTAGELIPADGDVIEGIATVDESAITGESAPVIRESGGDRSAVTGGTRVLSDRIVVRDDREAGRVLPRPHDRARRGRSPPEDAERDRARHPARGAHDHLPDRSRDAAAVRDLLRRAAVDASSSSRCSSASSRRRSAALLSAIGIAGMDRLVQRNVLALSGRAVEAAGDCDDAPARQDGHDHARQPSGDGRSSRHPASRRSELADAAQLSSLADETPEGRSIVVLAKERFGLREREPRRRGAHPVHRRRRG